MFLQRRLGLLLLVVFVLVLGTPLMAQESSRILVRVELWDVKREQWPAFVKMFEKYDKPVYEKLFQDGVINEWGLDSATLHRSDGYTHATWHAATSWEAFGKVEAAFDAAYKALGEKEQMRVETEFAGMLVKHRDYMLSSFDQRAKAVNLSRAYFFESMARVKWGQGEAYVSYWNKHVKPVFQKLFDEGVILAYGRGADEIVTDEPGTNYSWYVVGDLAGQDKVQAAFRAYNAKLSSEQQRARWASISEMVEVSSYRQAASRYLHWAIKAQ